MDNSDATQGHAMTPQEFAKLMGAYPQPAENPLPAYGGYMDNSPANFSFVEFNDYFGAEDKEFTFAYAVHDKNTGEEIDDGEVTVTASNENEARGEAMRMLEEGGLDDEEFHLHAEFHLKDDMTEGIGDDVIAVHNDEGKRVGMVALANIKNLNRDDDVDVYVTYPVKPPYYTGMLKDETTLIGEEAYDIRRAETFESETLHEKGDYRIIAEEGYDALRSFEKGMEEDEYQELFEQAETYGMFNLQVQKKVMGGWETIDSLSGVVPSDTDSLEKLALEWMEIPEGVDFDAETFEAPYAGAGSLFSIGQNTGLEGFTTSELTTSSAIHGDFDEASLNYSGHQNFEVRAEGDLQGYSEGQYADDDYITTDTRKGVTFVEGAFEVVEERENRDDEAVMVKFELPIQSFIRRLGDSITIDRDIYDAEMDMIDDSNARIKNRFNDVIGMVSVDDHDVEDAVVEVSDGSDMIQEVIVSESETVKKSLLPLALGALAAVVAFPTVTSLFTKKQEKAAETPELIESPDTGNLDPAQYEELVVESTGYAVDVIPQGLDGSFMGSRFAALPTERYVDYNEPGIGAHTDIALNRDEIYLEPEMAMVQASENVIKEAQAPGQSPYNSMTGEENPDFDFRVVKETQVISLDPAVKPFIPQSMSGYTGNANTPPSVLNKMFNTGVLGQTPAFVPGSGDIGASHTGSRNATPNALGLGGSVGGPLSDQVNASYTDGTTSMSLAQWSIENTVSQTSDTEAVVIDRSSGAMKRVRRV